MPALTCAQAGCTVAVTGTCLLSNPDPTACPNATKNQGSVIDVLRKAAREASPVTAKPEAVPLSSKEPEEARPPGEAAGPTRSGRRFPGGLELGTDDVARLLRARYGYVVGILGSWDAGKTCFLLSLYMQAARGELPANYRFAGSDTFPGFEARARRLRQWRGGPLPEQLADHTSLSDPRRPAFLHMALQESARGRQPFDVFFTDLPGEWSQQLVDRVTTATRFRFLDRADGIILVVDGPSLLSPAKHSELQRSKHLLERLVDAVRVDRRKPLVLLVSKADELPDGCPALVRDLESHAEELGFTPQTILSASFSRMPGKVPNGMGVFPALEKILNYSSPPALEQTDPRVNGGRAFLNLARRAT